MPLSEWFHYVLQPDNFQTVIFTHSTKKGSGEWVGEGGSFSWFPAVIGEVALMQIYS